MTSLKKAFLLASASFFCLVGQSLHAQTSKQSTGNTLQVLVLDAGHGGKDSGAVSKDKKVQEKNLTLDITTALAARIRADNPDLKVILTRVDDRYLTLDQRAQVANRNKADLFLSIHINSNFKTSPHGFSTHILGESSKRDTYALNMEICKKENSVLFEYGESGEMVEDFDPDNPEASAIIFSLMQNAYLEQSMYCADYINKAFANTSLAPGYGTFQNAFYVLWRTSCPAVLVECGFISNAGDLAYITSKKGKEEIVDALSKAFWRYKFNYDKSVTSASAESQAASAGIIVSSKGSSTAYNSGKDIKSTSNVSAEDKTDERSKGDLYLEHPEGQACYAIQILTSSQRRSKSDSCFKGYKVYELASGKLYKYVVSPNTDKQNLNETLKDVRKSFSDAFIIKIEDSSLLR